MRNLAIAFPEKGEAERRRILRASYINLGRRSRVHPIRRVFLSRVKSRVPTSVSSLEKCTRRNPGKGLMILSAHFGNFELLSAAPCDARLSDKPGASYAALPGR